MPVEIRLIVVDAAPLITLAAANSLDYLFYPDLPVVIPDAVFHEATAGASKLGAQVIIDWYRTNRGKVTIEPTEAFDAEQLLSEQAGYRPTRDLGERAAIEIVRQGHSRQVTQGRPQAVANSSLVLRQRPSPAWAETCTFSAAPVAGPALRRLGRDPTNGRGPSNGAEECAPIGVQSCPHLAACH